MSKEPENEIISYVEGLPEYPCTAAQEQEYHRDQDRVVAFHESAHAVAAWLLGVPIFHLKFSSESSPPLDVPRTEFPGIGTSGSGIISAISTAELLTVDYPWQTKSTGERFVHGCQQAFITLAGPRCSGEATSTNPFYVLQTHLHLEQAHTTFMVITGSSNHEADQECARLLRVVDQLFQDPRIQGIVEHLAKNFLRLRDMSGDEVTACIAQA